MDTDKERQYRCRVALFHRAQRIENPELLLSSVGETDACCPELNYEIVFQGRDIHRFGAGFTGPVRPLIKILL